MSITVNLRVVGIYFRAQNLVVHTPTPCVEDVMIAASAAYPDFGYIKSSADSTLKAAYITKTVPFVSEGGSQRKEGFYYLEDDLGINPIKTWQWYIVKPDGTIFNFGTKFVPFSLTVASGGYEVQDGDTIVWRLLSIVTDPIELTPRGRLRLDALIKASGGAAAGTAPVPVPLYIADAATAGKTSY